ncbi:CBL-interacting serine/threonine-protein kinase 25-like [Chenopodium quinoa]|uniref:CBL-interacting serine/threonine-protein kinase 25-like n=1 Tax=Chenopodium quinoa TaxID=63459 RepID=UPI000B779771|nr:CBL-interacting serine/threonine-protein kinase 25-like [Chenopodium quinoa]
MEGKVLFGKYELLKLLGEGNFGKVYKAKNITTDEIVAIKMINKDEVKKHGMFEQVKKEISVMRLVKHPNIVELKEVMATKTKIYLVMEYVGGGDLYTKIFMQGKLDENIARKFFQQVITAVDFCHSRGVCHRDLKLENIMLDSNGENVKICDFGLATYLGEKDESNSDALLGTACGAFAYMAPEILRGEKYDGKLSDIWSCGVILYAILAGYPPFQDESRTKMLRKIRICKYEFSLGFPEEVKDLLKKILVKNPKERIMISEIMSSPWFRTGLSGSYEGDSSLFCSSPESSFNAFDFMLCMASGLDLSGLFENKKRKLGSLFVTKYSTKEVLKKVEKMAEVLNYEARKEKESRVVLKGGEMGRRGRLVVSVEVFMVLPEVKVVEFLKRAGDPVEYLKLMEEQVRPAMKDVAWKWQGDWSHGRNNGGSDVFPRWNWCRFVKQQL